MTNWREAGVRSNTRAYAFFLALEQRARRRPPRTSLAFRGESGGAVSQIFATSSRLGALHDRHRHDASQRRLAGSQSRGRDGHFGCHSGPASHVAAKDSMRGISHPHANDPSRSRRLDLPVRQRAEQLPLHLASLRARPRALTLPLPTPREGVGGSDRPRSDSLFLALPQTQQGRLHANRGCSCSAPSTPSWTPKR